MTAIERSTSKLALDPRSRYLAEEPKHGYVLGAGERLAEALHRLTTEQFTVAIDALSDPEADVGIAAAATLTSMARVAAVLRLVRRSIGDEAYKTELAVLRETETLLRGLLAGQPELRALDQLRARYQPVLQPSALADLRSQLLQRHKLRRLKALSEGEALRLALQRLRRARARFGAWPIDRETDAPMYGREPVADSFESLAEGLRRTYRRGRKHWRSAQDGQDEAHPKWLRECRHLGHELEILRSSWPEVIGATASACRKLEAVLAEDQALATLQQVMNTDTTMAADGVEHSLLAAISAHARSELHDVAGVLGARLYVEPPDQFVARMEAYWAVRTVG